MIALLVKEGRNDEADMLYRFGKQTLVWDPTKGVLPGETQKIAKYAQTAFRIAYPKY